MQFAMKRSSNIFRGFFMSQRPVLLLSDSGDAPFIVQNTIELSLNYRDREIQRIFVAPPLLCAFA
jgi:hypothetical protein